MSRSQTSATARGWLASLIGVQLAVRLAGLLLAGLPGCQLPAIRAPNTRPALVELPPVPDRMRAFYQELKSGKFEILADLEKPEQVQIFRVEGAGQAQLTVRRSRIDTGAGALDVRLNDPQAALVVDDQSARDWAVPRDWSPYELLMASLYAPVPAVTTVRIDSGLEQRASWDSSAIPLQKGWNILRIDLREVGQTVNLADVRRMRLQLRADAWPVQFYLDDLMLADNTAVLFGDPKGPEGTLFVLKKGRRFHVGSVGRFELVLSRGLLADWYDLSVDPDRRTNLAGDGPAGPALTALDESGAPVGADAIESWKGLGADVRTHLQIVETNALCVTLKGLIQFTPQEPAATTAPTADVAESASPAFEHAYLYTIRADGRVFVDISAQVASPRFAPARIGLAGTSLHRIFQLQPVDPLAPELLARLRRGPQTASAPAAGAESEPAGAAPIPRALLLARGQSAGASLLLVPYNPARYERTLCAVREGGDVMACMYVMRPPTGPHLEAAAMLSVWPPDLKDLATAAAIARDYQEPAAPRIEVGRLRTDSQTDRDGDGFAEGTGRWSVRPDGQIVRLRWPAGQLRFWPMLEVAGLEGKPCWAYLDGRIIKPVERRTNGDAIFVVPQILSRSALLEVMTGR